MDTQKKSRRRKLGWLGISLLLLLGAGVVFAVVMLVKGLSAGDIRRGAWEGNYLYAGNGKSKTTGEDYETLVDTVGFGGADHAVTDCYGSYFRGDEALLFLKTDAPGKNICLVRYDLKTESSEFLFAEDEEFFSLTEEDFERSDDGFRSPPILDAKIYTILDDAIVFRSEPPLEEETEISSFFRVVDFSGTVLEETDDAVCFFPLYYDVGGEEFLFFEKEGGLYYRTWTDPSPRLLLSAGQLKDRDATVIYDDGRFYIQTCPRDTWGNVGYSLYFRDLGQPRTAVVLEADFENHFAAEWVSYSGHYLTYETYSVAVSEDNIRHFNKNCVMYRYDEKTAGGENIAELPSSNNYWFILTKKGYLEFYCHTPEAIAKGDLEAETKLVELSTGNVLEEAPWSDETSAAAIAERGLVCGDYVYAVTQEVENLFYPFYIKNRHSLVRLNKTTGQTEIMQYMRVSASALDVSQEGKYCKEMENIFYNDTMLATRGRFSVSTIRDY